MQATGLWLVGVGWLFPVGALAVGHCNISGPYATFTEVRSEGFGLLLSERDKNSTKAKVSTHYSFLGNDKFL